jgi:hypothetical protein
METVLERAGGISATNWPIRVVRRPCVFAKGIESCARCDRCPCAKLMPFCASPLISFVDFGDVAPGDYDLAMRQFDNVPELMRMRTELRGRARC